MEPELKEEFMHYAEKIGAYSGRGSDTAYDSFLDSITYSTPKKAVWCLGMNDADSGSINSNWLTAIQEFVSVCKSNGIEPILATIPSVPTRDHSYKNAWVKASGERYIDFEKAVGADADVNWYTGMLSVDEVHPTVLGAQALYMQAITDVPEFMES